MNSTIVESWATERLGNIVDIKTGKLDSNFAEEKGKYPFFTCAPNPLRINHFAFDCEAILLAGNNADGIFHLNFYNGKFNAYQRTYVITTKDENGLDLHYLYYYLQLSLNVLKDFSQGTSTKFLTMRILKELEINLPSFEEQKKIAKILADLDSKIELNERMNRSLEAVGAALFRRWFVDFEFPNQEGNPYKTTGGKMRYNEEIGLEIPEIFKVGSIYDLCEVIYGFPFSSKHFNSKQEGRPLIRIRDLKTLNPDFYTTENEDSRMTLVNPGDIIAGMDAEFTPWIWLGDSAYLNQRLCMFKPQKNVHKFVIYQIIKPLLKREEQAKVGTTVIHLAKSDIDRWHVIIPNDKTLSLFSDLIQPFFERLVINGQQIRALTHLRDLLLPRLMSGKIRVPLNKEK